MKLYITPIAPDNAQRRVSLNSALVTTKTQIRKPAQKPRRQVIQIGSNAAFDLEIGRKVGGDNARDRVILKVFHSNGELKMNAKEFLRKKKKERAKILRYSKSSQALSLYRQGHIIRILFEYLP